MLDVDYGSYPFVTSSNTSVGGIYTGAGVPYGNISEVLGIAKAYTTRVGEGPFPTEISEDVGKQIQKIGKEEGATTGRIRRCGWLDLPLLKYAVKSSNMTSLALTKLDILTQIKELKLCKHYNYQGKKIDCAFPGINFSEIDPIFTDMEPFSDDFTKPPSPALSTYLKTIEDAILTPIGILAFGPERKQIMFRKEYF